MTTRSVVVKIGTSSVTDDTGGVAYGVLVNIALDVVDLRAQGWNGRRRDLGRHHRRLGRGGQGPAPSDRQRRRCRRSRRWGNRC